VSVNEVHSFRAVEVSGIEDKIKVYICNIVFFCANCKKVNKCKGYIRPSTSYICLTTVLSRYGKKIKYLLFFLTEYSLELVRNSKWNQAKRESIEGVKFKILYENYL
jgi:hypothetical protein